jgi:hypothetical protein
MSVLLIPGYPRSVVLNAFLFAHPSWNFSSTLYLKTCRYIKNVVFWDVTQLLVTANVVPSSQILFTLMTEAIRSSATSILTGVTSQKTSS